MQVGFNEPALLIENNRRTTDERYGRDNRIIIYKRS